MKSILCVSLLILLMPSSAYAELPGDSADGKRLHDANCMGCHDTASTPARIWQIKNSPRMKSRTSSST
jgi:mono/diheme cytochrome c family protein